ncbi:hypothetical protein GCM10011506_34140 [Marivirga lumbricoides]|uniref:Helix-turn-helix domain-containing protein n=1 Tax=Marivirga lumbricoides TaxID=1046115 RepID=A0ABQ1MRV6_9BACT|nr:hypothetical protein GCM10011506_34140 [Marivirga lumbricoides]
MQNPFEEINLRLQRIEEIIRSNPAQQQAVKDTNPEERLTRAEVAKQFKISLPTVHKLMLEDNLPYEKIGRNTRFRRADIEAYFSSKRRVGHGR